MVPKYRSPRSRLMTLESPSVWLNWPDNMFPRVCLMGRGDWLVWEHLAPTTQVSQSPPRTSNFISVSYTIPFLPVVMEPCTFTTGKAITWSDRGLTNFATSPSLWDPVHKTAEHAKGTAVCCARTVLSLFCPVTFFFYHEVSKQTFKYFKPQTRMTASVK